MHIYNILPVRHLLDGHLILELSWKLPSCWLACVVTETALQLGVKQRHLCSYLEVNPMDYGIILLGEICPLVQ